MLRILRSVKGTGSQDGLVFVDRHGVDLDLSTSALCMYLYYGFDMVPTTCP
jgi:hypothetical protein